MPARNPTAAGRNASLPIFSSDCSIAGISRLHTLAAVITPAAKPVSMRCIVILKEFFIGKTQAAPRDVPRKGTARPFITSNIFTPFLVSKY